ncbi:hypothetical protein PYK79_50635 [Streptomyces sp. ID05-04B]|uniref:hypothetical protein n=1 Tax=unclassified Streptomyces TaxID=2593676 RepID=UPI00131F2652|nr:MULTISPECIES: hypothetical protein [unclassified Streptomyces]MDX5569908.1 hypothetical protein [Streptomyces sp. ID05-04B]
MRHDHTPDHGSDSAPLSVLLLKPDGYLLPGLRAHVDRLIARHELSVVTRYTLTLGARDVEDVWPKLAVGAYPVAHQLTLHYMTSGVCEALVVSGRDVVARCTAIRTEVRRDFGDTVFANRLHTPTEPGEVGPCVQKFLHSIPHGAPHTRHHDPGSAPGAFGRLAALPSTEVHAAALDIWRRRHRDGWQSFRLDVPHGAHATYLLPGDSHSVDYGMSVLAELLPDLSLRQIITAYIEMDVRGESCLRSGTAEETALLADRITAAGLFAQARTTRPTAGRTA